MGFRKSTNGVAAAYLDEPNVLGVAAETLPAAHQPILPDQSMGVPTDPATKNNKLGVSTITRKHTC